MWVVHVQVFGLDDAAVEGAEIVVTVLDWNRGKEELIGRANVKVFSNSVFKLHFCFQTAFFGPEFSNSVFKLQFLKITPPPSKLQFSR